MARVRLADVAFARAGDKGDTANVALFARGSEREADIWAVMCDQVTPQRVRELLGSLATGSVTVHEVENLGALNVVIEGALGGGGASSLRADNLGKALGGAVLRLEIEVPDDLLAAIGPRPEPPADPYAGAAWRV